MNRSDEVYVEDIINSINLIFRYLNDKTESDFSHDLMLQDAVTRRFEIIGEASSKISQLTKDNNPTIEWRLMKAMRNKLIHEYFGVSSSTIYKTVKLDLPSLLTQLTSMKIR